MARKPGRAKRARKEDIKAAADRAEKRARGEAIETPADPILDPPETARDAKGRFGAGNRFWEARSSAGPRPMFARAEDLWKACCEYFEWVEQNPLWEAKIIGSKDGPSLERQPKMRAMTVAGLCIFLDIDRQTWAIWKKNRPDLVGIITRAEEVIYAQKFSGAAADLLNANIIARDLGLADKKEVTGKDGADLMPEPSSRDLARAVVNILGAAQMEQDQ